MMPGSQQAFYFETLRTWGSEFLCWEAAQLPRGVFGILGSSVQLMNALSIPIPLTSTMVLLLTLLVNVAVTISTNMAVTVTIRA